MNEMAKRTTRLLQHQIAGLSHMMLARRGMLPEDFTSEQIHPVALKRLLSGSRHINLSSFAYLAAITEHEIDFNLSAARPREMCAADIGMAEPPKPE